MSSLKSANDADQLMEQDPVLTQPKITFGVLLLNGEPFTLYCLRAIYPHAHQIIVVEGAVKNAR